MRKPLLNRRQAIRLSLAAAPLLLSPPGTEAEVPAAQLGVPARAGVPVPLDFVGLSYETAQLYNPDFFSAQNAALVEAFRALSPSGVLRLGGHLSNITPWEGAGVDDPKQQRGVRHGIEDYWEWPLVDPSIQASKHGTITRRALANLAAFLDAVNWRLLYTLNFASGSPERAADEASTVHAAAGNRLLAFLLGNEVEGYAEDRFFRDPGYSFETYFTEYEQWVAAVRARVPGAPFAGPETDGHVSDWVVPFAQKTRGQVALLTSHFYAMGPASDPAMTAERLLQPRNARLEDEITAVHRAVGLSKTRYRMDEGNSCFGGGRPGVSDAFASALWAADYMLYVACAGFAGVNLHGGGTGFYTPIETSRAAAASPRPAYFGMQFAQQFTGLELSRCSVHTPQNVTAYLGRKGPLLRLAIINKDQEPARVRLPEGLNFRSRSWVLQGPSLGAKTGVRFVESAASIKDAVVAVPRYSGVVLESGK